MGRPVILDYGCHSFSYRLATYLWSKGYDFAYLTNGSLESPNVKSLPSWTAAYPDVVIPVMCRRSYGKLHLGERLSGELQWARSALKTLKELQPSAIICSCAPLPVARRLQKWAARQNIPFVYWLQDLQGRAIGNLLGQRLGTAGRIAGQLAERAEKKLLERSNFVITIAPDHKEMLPAAVRHGQRFGLLENWADIEKIPLLPHDNEWSRKFDLHETVNVIYAGTLGFKHDLGAFVSMAESFADQPTVRVVVVSSGQAADELARRARQLALTNLIVLPFQPYEAVAQVLAAATVLIAPLDPSAGSFCVPSKILAYHCAGRPIVLSIDRANPAARMIRTADSGIVVEPGNTSAFTEAVSKLLADTDARVWIGLNGRRFAEGAFRIEAVAARFLKLLASANVPLKHPTAPRPATPVATPPSQPTAVNAL